MKCPKCGYTRKFGETAPEWQCPSCGIAYAKADAGVDARSPARAVSGSAGSGGAGKFIMLLVAIAAVAAWGLVPGLRQGAKPVDQDAIANSTVIMYSLTTCGFCRLPR